LWLLTDRWPLVIKESSRGVVSSKDHLCVWKGSTLYVSG
jgi:hypothetical protein